MRILVALGGNALLKRGEPLSPENQAANLKIAADGIAALIKAGHEIVVSHGNGPQVGLLALQQAAMPGDPFPLDVLGAESQGMIGYMLEQALDNALDSSHLLATLLTQTRVDRRDPEEPLLLALGNKLFQPGLLLFRITHAGGVSRVEVEKYSRTL